MLGNTPREDCESFATWKKSDSSLSAGTGEFVDEDDLESLESSVVIIAGMFGPEEELAPAAAAAAAAAELRAAMTSREGAGGRMLAG